MRERTAEELAAVKAAGAAPPPGKMLKRRYCSACHLIVLYSSSFPILIQSDHLHHKLTHTFHSAAPSDLHTHPHPNRNPPLPLQRPNIQRPRNPSRPALLPHCRRPPRPAIPRPVIIYTPNPHASEPHQAVTEQFHREYRVQESSTFICQ